MLRYVRVWLPPVCLLLAIAALWAFPGQSECPDDHQDGSPAIARVNNGCLYALQYGTYLRDLSLNLVLSESASEADGPGLGAYLEGRQRLVDDFGLENAAFATLVQDLILYREAVAEGYAPNEAEIMAVMGTNRERIRGLSTLLELHKLARNADFEGFRDLIESPDVRRMVPVQGEEHLLALFEEAAAIDLSGAVRGMEVHSELLRVVGDDRYWTEVFFETARRLVAIESYRLTFDEVESGDSSALRWQHFKERIWGHTVIELTNAVPQEIRLENVRSYMNELHSLERELLTK